MVEKMSWKLFLLSATTHSESLAEVVLRGISFASVMLLNIMYQDLSRDPVTCESKILVKVSMDGSTDR